MTVSWPVWISARGERYHVPPGLSLGRSRLPWAAVIIMPSPGAGEDRDDRGSGSACAKAVGTTSCHGVGTSVTAKTPNAGGNCGVGKRHGGKPDDARTMQSKSSTPRRNVRAVSVPHLRRKYQKYLRLRRRVVTQQNFFCRLPCATGRGAMSLPRSPSATRRVSAVPPAVRQFAECGNANANGCCEPLSEAAGHAIGSMRPPGRGGPDSNRTPPERRHSRRRHRDQVPRLRRSAIMALPRQLR
jgi:hypothetical protein